MRALRELTPEERSVYAWQFPVDGFGEAGQRALAAGSVLVSRCGGLGGVVAYELAAAGVGRLVIAHAGDVKPSDLNRQLLVTHDGIGRPRIESIVRRLHDLNPRLEVTAIGENVDENNAEGLVEEVDLVVDCAPLFPERRAMARAAHRRAIPVVECAMYELEATLTVLRPPATPCFDCLYPIDPPTWKREFPVFGAVSGAVGCLAAMEAIKLLAGFGDPVAGRLVSFDLRDTSFTERRLERRSDCPRCGAPSPAPSE